MSAYIPGKIAVVTGGAGGIGRAIAVALAESGARVAILDLDPRATADAVANLPGSKSHLAIACDVRAVDAVSRAAETIERHFGGADILVNNAGVYARGAALQISLEDLHWVHEVNFWGAVHCTRAFAPLLRRRPRAHIANILSDFAFFGFPHKAAYCSSKAALLAFSDCLRQETRGDGLTVLDAIPPAIDTALVRGARGDVAAVNHEAEFIAQHGKSAARFAAAFVGAIESRRERLVYGCETRAALLLARFAPRTLRWLIRIVGGRLKLT